jgi:hypothetical protein
VVFAVTRPKLNPALKPVVGTWFLKEGEKENRSTKIALRPDGTFVISGSGWESKGVYTVKKGELAFTWTEVDGSEVPSGTVKRTVELSSNLTSFNLDQFTYGKQLAAVH